MTYKSDLVLDIIMYAYFTFYNYYKVKFIQIIILNIKLLFIIYK